MKVIFFTNTNNEKTGSYRIWVRDLNRSLIENGIESKIVFRDLNQIDSDADVVIFCKSSYTMIDVYKKIKKDTLIGAINIDRNYLNSNIDFVIVGSPEEYASLSSYKNVFIYPLIERKFENIERKVHTQDSEKLKVCFHGHYPHLFKFEPFLKNALEEYNRSIKKIELHVITGHKNFNWEKGKPDIDIVIHDYDENLSNILKSCDVGLVPNVTDIRLFYNDIVKINSVDHGLYNTDYFLRFKNKTNAGRSYVFYQHGIPVIHDLSPSSFEMMKITGYNICAHDNVSWLRELVKLSDFTYREEVSKSYYEAFKKYYNPIVESEKLINNIKEIK